MRTSRLLSERAVHLLHSSPLSLRWCWRVPVVQHLDGEDQVEDEASNESVKDEWVVNFLNSCEDARKRASKVVEDLQNKLDHIF